MKQHNYIKLLAVALLLGVLSLTLSRAYAVVAATSTTVAVKVDKGDLGEKDNDGLKGADEKYVIACTPYHLRDIGPDGGIVYYVDGSGCHGLEAQPYDVGATSENSNVGVPQTWTDAVSTALAGNTTAITTALSCSTTVEATTPNCWHLPSKTELEYLYEQKTVVDGFANNSYWSSTETNRDSAWFQNFLDGYQNSNSKNITLHVRVVRAF